MNGLSPLEERNGLSPERMRQRAAENASKIISARRLGATQTVRKSGPGGSVIQIFDARMVLLATVDIAGMSEGVVSEIERAAVQSPYTYQRQAIAGRPFDAMEGRAVRKASAKAPMIAVYDDAGDLVGALDPAKLHKVSKSGDEAVMNAMGTVIGYASAKDVRPLRSLSAGAAKPKPAAPARTAVPTAPASATVQKAQQIVRSRNATREQIRWAVDILDRHSVRKSATRPAAPQGKLVYRYVDGKLVSKAIER